MLAALIVRIRVLASDRFFVEGVRYLDLKCLLIGCGGRIVELNIEASVLSDVVVGDLHEQPVLVVTFICGACRASIEVARHLGASLVHNEAVVGGRSSISVDSCDLIGCIGWVGC